jgi:hypothetical protein
MVLSCSSSYSQKKNATGRKIFILFIYLVQFPIHKTVPD